MKPVLTIQDTKTAKRNFRDFLGGESADDLNDTISQTLRNDYLKEDSYNVFRNLTSSSKQEETSILSQIANNASKAHNNAIKNRIKIAATSTVGFFAALGVSFANPIAGLAMAATNSLVSGIAESTHKRTISGIGHFEGHFFEKVGKQLKSLLERSLENGGFTKEGQEKIEGLLREVGNNKKVSSGLARLISYVSTPAISATQRGLTLSEIISKTVSTVLGVAIPILPLITVGLSHFASKTRHENTKKIAGLFDKVSDEIFNPANYVSREVPVETTDLTTQFRENLSTCDNHGRNQGEKGYHEDRPAGKLKRIFNALKTTIIIPNKIGAGIVNWGYRIFRADPPTDLTKPKTGGRLYETATIHPSDNEALEQPVIVEAVERRLSVGNPSGQRLKQYSRQISSP